jgi:hypothetical protein
VYAGKIPKKEKNGVYMARVPPQVTHGSQGAAAALKRRRPPYPTWPATSLIHGRSSRVHLSHQSISVSSKGAQLKAMDPWTHLSCSMGHKPSFQLPTGNQPTSQTTLEEDPWPLDASRWNPPGGRPLA